MDETKRRPGNNRSDSGTKKLSEDSLKRNNKKRSNKVNSEAEKCREKAEGVKPPRMIKRSARKDINENKAQNRRQPSKYKREAIKTEDPLKNRGFEQGWKSTIVRSSRVSRERIDQLSKPSKSVLLTTWQTYSDVFDYDRMRKIMDKLHYEFSLTPQEKKMCMEQMKKNAIELSNKIALGSTEEIRRLHIGTEDLQRLSLLSNQAKNVRRSRRTEELARPRSYKVLATWNEYNHILPSDKRMKFQRKYVDNLLNQIT